jgi:hypothetical protein
MPNTAPQDGVEKLRERLTVLESGLQHFQTISEMRHDHTREAFARVDQRNDRQDTDLEALEEKLLTKIDAISTMLWAGMRWGGGLIAAALLTIVLKGLSLL